MTNLTTDLCIVGGGPAGMMAGLLFARAGVSTIVLEKHGDFLRDFRGDTVHPSTLEVFHELGLLPGLLARPHDKVGTVSAHVSGQRVQIADFSRLPTQCRFIAMMPQWEFLDFVAEEARRYPAFQLLMHTNVTGIWREDGRVAGVVATGATGTVQVGARLVIAADGRGSVLRDAVGLPRTDLGAPIDVFWFRVPKPSSPDNQTTGNFAAGKILVMIDRGEYWQCAYAFAKGAAATIRARGLASFRHELTALTPLLGPGVASLNDWDQVKLLTVKLDRLDRWHCPGFLAIGDAAHAMSPVGGIGINMAIQDAVAAANLLAAPMARGEPVDRLLAAVERRRRWPTHATQRLQKLAHDRVIGRVLGSTAALTKPPWPLRLLDRFAWLQQVPARLVGLGLRPEHVRSPVAVAAPSP